MYKSVVYMGDEFLADVEIYPQQQKINGGDGRGEREEGRYKMEKIQIGYFSQPSERCPPLAVLHTITSSSSGICFKMESDSSLSQSQDSLLSLLHSSCIRDNKTAVIPLGQEELHLVAMYSRNNSGQYPCFWCFSAGTGLYNSCLVMLNLRCLGIVFDLDETLIVANTMRSFEDKIEALNRKISMETDQKRISGMVAEARRYQEDKNILKQYIENDQVIEYGKVLKTQSEIAPALSEGHQPIVRPLIRIHEKNIILTRINPLIRDTSVLVRLRPAWEDLRSYLIARGRKRFEVYVCTMAEREYAFEMWRLLDPEFNLISSKELLERIVCVKSGLKKSLFDVFQDGTCHPKMALVIDDRLKVWDEKDQARVHVVPAFAPYYAPQAEVNNATPILCVARNVACNVRGGFFKDFDDCLLQRISEVAYEDDCRDIFSPDVSIYLVPEDVSAGPNGNKDPDTYDGMVDAEIESRLKDGIAASSARTQLDPRVIASLHNAVVSSANPISLPASLSATAPSSSASLNPPLPPISPLVVNHFGLVGQSEQVRQNSPAREEGEVPESELDPDTRRRLLILQHGQDIRDQPAIEPFPAKPSIQDSVPSLQFRESSWGGMEEEHSPRRLNRASPKEHPIGLDMHVDKQISDCSPSFLKNERSPLPERLFHESQRLPQEMNSRDAARRSGNTPSAYNSFSGSRGHGSVRTSGNGETPAAVLLDIAMKCGTKVEFRHGVVASMDLHFSVEAWFGGEKIGEGLGRTRREAQHQAAEGSLRHLANIYMVRTKPDATSGNDVNRFSHAKDNGFLGSVNSPTMVGERMVEGLDVDFQLQPGLSNNSEISVQAAERSLCNLRSRMDQFPPKRCSPPPPRGLFQGVQQQQENKRLKAEYPQWGSVVQQQMYSSSASTPR